MSIYERMITGTIDGPKLPVWPLINDFWLINEGTITWGQVQVRFDLSAGELAELQSWYDAMDEPGNKFNRLSDAHQVFIGIERGDFTEATFDEENVELTPRVYHRLTEQQVLTYLGL